MNLNATRKILLLLNLMPLTVLIIWFSQGNKQISFPTTNISSSPISKIYSIPSTQGCHFTDVDAFDPKIIKKARKYPPINCKEGRPWLVYIDGPFLKVNVSKVRENPKAENFTSCRYRTLTKGTKNDKKCIYGPWSEHFTDKITIDNGAVFIQAQCYDKSDTGISSSYLSNIVLQDKTDKNSHAYRYTNHLKRYAPKETLSVLLVGIDGLSKQNFERSMPKTRQFVKHDLNAIELQKHSKVGLNTFPNILPLLTGHHQDFYKSMNWTKKQPFDKIGSYFIWKEFSRAGYRTAFDLEERYVTAFHYLKRGFTESPVDYYTRPLVIAMAQNKKLNTRGRVCKGDKPSISIHNDFLLQLATRLNDSSSPYFAFSFLTLLTHDDQNRASAGDDLYFDFLQRLRDGGAFNNTILILFSDHGARFGSIRNTYNGIIESKSPAAFVVLPEWFKSKHPDEFKWLQINSNRLTSVLDIHATLKDIIYFKSASPPVDLFSGPGISLFQRVIPETRTCEDAGIPIEYCNCNSLTKVKLDKNTSKYLSSVVIDNMMKALGKFTIDKCHKIVLKRVRSILEIEPPKDRRKKKTRKPNAVLYHITIATTPGHGMFEAVVELDKKVNKASVVGSISRLDMYKGEKDCITDPNIRPFCFCK